MSRGWPLDGRARTHCLATVGDRFLATPAAVLADVVAIRSISCVACVVMCMTMSTGPDPRSSPARYTIPLNSTEY